MPPPGNAQNAPRGQVQEPAVEGGFLSEAVRAARSGAGNARLTRPSAVSEDGVRSSTAERLCDAQRVAGSIPVARP